MIVDALIYVGLGIVGLFASVLPASEGLPTSFETGLQSLFTMAFKFDDFIPVSLLLTTMVSVFLFEAGIMAYRFARWFFASVPLSPIKHK